MEKHNIKIARDIGHRLTIALGIAESDEGRREESLERARRYVLQLYQALVPAMSSAQSDNSTWFCGRCRKEWPATVGSCRPCQEEIRPQP